MGSIAKSSSAGRIKERGHLLVAVMVGITILTILMAVAAEKWSTILKRDREEELIFRGLQYAQAMADYQKEHGALPVELEVLLKKGPRGHRYIRKLFREPFAEDGKWGRLVLAPGGQAVVNLLTQEMRPISMLMQGSGTGKGAPQAGLPLGPQTPEQFGLRAPRSSPRFQGRGQQPAPPSGGSIFRSSVTQISPFPPEQLANGPIAGVVSAEIDEKSFMIYEGYDRNRDFWFTVFRFSPGPAQPPGGEQGFMPSGIGPGGVIRGPAGTRPGQGGLGGNKPPGL